MQTIDERASVVAELLKTPFIKDILRDYLANIEPPSGARLVRTVLWQDPELLFALVGAVPAIVNTFIQAVAETGRQLTTFPPELMLTFASKVGQDIDAAQLQEALRGYGDLVRAVLDQSPALRQAWLDSLPVPAARAAGTGINSLAENIVRLQQHNPGYFDDLAAHTVEGLDQETCGRAGAILAHAFLNQRLSVVGWAWRLVRARLRNNKRPLRRTRMPGKRP